MFFSPWSLGKNRLLFFASGGMCSLFMQKMEKDGGDLADIVLRASGGVTPGGNKQQIIDWEIPSVDFPGSETIDNFGDPFSTIQDPLLHDLVLRDSGAFFQAATPQSTTTITTTKTTNNQEHDTTTPTTTLSGSLLAQTILDEEMRRPSSSNLFSRMLQISPNPNLKIPVSPHAVPLMGSPRGVVQTSANDMIKVQVDSSTSCSVQNAPVQISSPRNPGIKRRKSQAKKVVCIPAPSAANSRPGGEVVPSDLWAWRKYGQKPIKGSPYPRGYYRCSSSKGCSARKQVERSRTDPNMLVITYTSEHNHPWPTQRNALAGSTRSQPTKISRTSPSTNTMEEHKEKIKDSSSIMSSSSIKEEMDITSSDGELLDESNYKPAGFKSNQPDDFFADLGELDPDNLFTQGFTGERSEEERDRSKALDPFSLFDWAGNNNSFGEAKGGF